MGVSRPPPLSLFCIHYCNVDVYFLNNPPPPPHLKVQGHILGNTINTFFNLLSAASGPLTHFRGKNGEKKYELCLVSQYFSSQTFEQIKATLKNNQARRRIPGCLSNGAAADEFKNLWNCIFKHDHCSKSSCWDGPLRYAHVKKHLNIPTDPQTRPEIAELWSSKFSPSRYTLNDNYYLNQLSMNNYVPLLTETYQEAKTTGEVSLKHWNVTEGFNKYSVYEYSFASNCPGNFNSGYFLRRKFDWLPYVHQKQEIVEYWQKKIAAMSTVRYVEREECTLFRWGSIFPYGDRIDPFSGTSRRYWARHPQTGQVYFFRI